MSASIKRREFLESGLTIVGASLLGGSLSACFPERTTAPPLAGPLTDVLGATATAAMGDLLEPPVIRSVGGRLTTTITASTNSVTIGGRTALQPVTYNGVFPGPTLMVRPGDFVDLTFNNRIVQSQASTKPGYGRPPRMSNQTDLHYHGMHVSPNGTADNMAVMVDANGSWRYQFQIPSSHPAGLFWYHAHVHGLVTNHVSRGAAGMLYVANSYTDSLAQLGIRQRLMMLQQAYFQEDGKTLTFDDGNRDDPDLALSVINGALMPDIYIRPGEPQVWSLINGSSSAFYMLRLEGHTFDIIAEDGFPYTAPKVGLQTLLLPSARRYEVVVRGNGAPGRYTLSYDEHFQGVDTWPQKSIGTVVVDGAAWSGPSHPGVDPTTPPENLSGYKVKKGQQRTITLGVNTSVPEGTFGRFTINGHSWDPSYSEWTSALGSVEEWTFVNETEQDHPMHVHTNPMQVMSVNNVAVPFNGYADTVIVPRFGKLVARTRFIDFPGDLILMHCHILDHEDMGMMIRFAIV
jgi:FtsP/CotA-like multicopper oxidase with cupredoxin domain